MRYGIDPKRFWDDKILVWENDRYGEDAAKSSLLERFGSRPGNTLQYRLSVTPELLQPYLSGKRIVEFGCGSGLLAETLLSLGAIHYQGYDIAPSAVERARRQAAEAGISEMAQFDVASVEEFEPLDADIILSLGLLDWLDDDALATLFRIGGRADYFHSISEKRFSAGRLLHRLYVHLAYGYRTGGYVPRYYTIAQIAALARPCHDDHPYVYRDRRLSFGALVSSLPIAAARS